jgi:phosphohistidine phosphatase
MKVYLVQHAEAKREDEDPARPLSDRGREDVKRVAEFLKPLGLKVSRILHSGKLRAKQTAEIISGGISSEKGIQEASGLAPLDDPSEWVQRLSSETEDVMLVGHLPHLARLAGILLTGNPEHAPIKFRQGGVVCLERSEEGKWLVAWAVTPELVR